MKIIILLLSFLVIALSQPQPSPADVPVPEAPADVPAPEAPIAANVTVPEAPVEVPAPESPEASVEAPGPEAPIMAGVPGPEVPVMAGVPEPEAPEMAEEPVSNEPQNVVTPTTPTPALTPTPTPTPSSSGVVSNPPYYVELKALNPIGMCNIQKAERWVTFFFYSSDANVTRPITNTGSINWAVQTTDDKQDWKNSTSDSPNGYPGQPTTLKKGFFPAFALSTPFFTVPNGYTSGRFKLRTVKYQLDSLYVEMNVDAPKYNCPATASFVVKYSSENSGSGLESNLKAKAAALLQTVNITNADSRLTITKTTSGTTSTYTFNLKNSGYQIPQNLSEIWKTYKKVWPAEVQPPHQWELLFLLASKLDFAAEAVGGAVLKSVEIQGFSNQAFKLPANALKSDNTKASNPDGTPYDPNWVDPDATPTENSGNSLIAVITMYLITLSLMFI